jgi:hypothetical protein
MSSNKNCGMCFSPHNGSNQPVAEVDSILSSDHTRDLVALRCYGALWVQVVRIAMFAENGTKIVSVYLDEWSTNYLVAHTAVKSMKQVTNPSIQMSRVFADTISKLKEL